MSKESSISWLAALLILAGIFLVLARVDSGSISNSEVKSQGFSLSGKLFDRFDTTSTSLDGDKIILLKSNEGDAQVRINVISDISEQEARKYSDSKIFVIKSLYREIRSPYPGKLSNRIGCDQEFKPLQIEGDKRSYYRLFSTERLTYGACSWDLIDQKVLLSYIYCGNEKKLYQIELFAPLDSDPEFDEETIQNVICKDSGPTISLLGWSTPPLLKNGEEWWPLGQNVAWIEKEDPHDYEYYFRKLSQADVELVRLILTPWHLHERWGSSEISDSEIITEIKHILNQAERFNLSVILALDIYGELRTESSDPREKLWHDNPHNAVNGGNLEFPHEFFTDSNARIQYKERLDQLVEDLRDQDALYMWEFWNEVDLTDGYDELAVCAWHDEMAKHLDNLDSERYITTSLADFRNGDCIWKIPEIDVVTIHYHGEDIIEEIPNLRKSASRYDKPILLEEFSGGNTPTHEIHDPDGTFLFDVISAVQSEGYSSGPMIWWWDSYIDRNNLYHIYEEASSEGQ